MFLTTLKRNTTTKTKEKSNNLLCIYLFFFIFKLSSPGLKTLWFTCKIQFAIKCHTYHSLLNQIVLNFQQYNVKTPKPQQVPFNLYMNYLHNGIHITKFYDHIHLN
jgi:hypothetical protein